eukprot:1161304-Pelagomonas_calceolata.AAC.8
MKIGGSLITPGLRSHEKPIPHLHFKAPPYPTTPPGDREKRRPYIVGANQYKIEHRKQDNKIDSFTEYTHIGQTQLIC